MIRLVIGPEGRRFWLLNNQCHRANGPAMVLYSAQKYWFWHGKRVSEYELMILAGQQQLNDQT